MQDSVVPEIKARLNIVDVVGSYVRLTKAGAYWKACCPFHNEKTPSFTVNEERQAFHCFGCGKGGDILSFVEEMEGVEFREALKLLAERAGVEVPKYRRNDPLSPERAEEPDRTREILELSTKFFEKQLWEGEGAKRALPYLRKRGLSDETIRTFRLGYSLAGWRHLHDFLLSRGYRADELERAGLVIAKEGRSGHYDRFRDRIMFPISDVVGRVIGYSARVTPGGDESQAKYINTPETPVYHKGRVLYGLPLAKQAIKEAGATILVEGQMDVIACHQAGMRNTVAASGTALTGEQLDVLKRYGREIRLFFDMDGAGQAAAWKSALLAFGKEMSVSVVLLPEGKDAADAALGDVEGLRSAVNRPVQAARYFLDRLVGTNGVSTPEGKRAVVEGYAPLLSAMMNGIDRDFWRKELSEAVGIEERILSMSLPRAESSSGREASTGTVSRGSDQTYRTRSEVLRDRIAGLLLFEPALRSKESLSGALPDILSSDPLFLVIRSAGKDGDPLSERSDEALKRRAAKLLFDAEETMRGGDEESGSEDRRARAEQILNELLGQLSAESRREELQALAKAVDEARTAGDRTLEKKLLADLVEKSRTN
ncbi:MAG: DNA primase [Candidatus Moranbacteria bacterium]|nr:DNA primase [Candidatus Moranbacteria bacterium]